jgi:hypothetical protein
MVSFLSIMHDLRLIDLRRLPPTQSFYPMYNSQAICVGAHSMSVRTHSSGQERYLVGYMNFVFKDERIDL